MIYRPVAVPATRACTPRAKILRAELRRIPARSRPNVEDPTMSVGRQQRVNSRRSFRNESHCWFFLRDMESQYDKRRRGSSGIGPPSSSPPLTVTHYLHIQLSSTPLTRHEHSGSI